MTRLARNVLMPSLLGRPRGEAGAGARSRRPGLSGFTGRLGKEATHERPHVAAAALGALRLALFLLAHRQGQRDFFPALVAVERVERHDRPPLDVTDGLLL